MAANIFLTGFMGTGKTTISRQLSEMTKLREADMDRIIETRKGMKINDIFAAYGEAYFRDLETKLVKEYEKKSGYIISCGGGCVLRPENVKSMKKNGLVIWLTATPQTVYERVRHSKNRPLLNGNMNVEYIMELMERRNGFYEAAADITIVSDRREPGEIAEEIIKMLKNPNFSFDFSYEV